MVPYEMPPERGLIAVGGQTACFKLQFPSRALIAKVVVEQVDSFAAVGFALRLFNRNGVCADTSVSDSVSVGPGVGEAGEGYLPSRLFAVSPLWESTAPGYFEYFADDTTGGFGLVFFNQDNRDAIRGAPVRPKQLSNLYLQIAPGGIGAYEFAVCIAGLIYQ